MFFCIVFVMPPCFWLALVSLHGSTNNSPGKFLQSLLTNQWPSPLPICMMPAPERCSDFPNEFCDHCFDFVFSLFFDLPEFISAKLSFRFKQILAFLSFPMNKSGLLCLQGLLLNLFTGFKTSCCSVLETKSWYVTQIFPPLLSAHANLVLLFGNCDLSALFDFNK